jgi:multiple sugar transport system permease protein
VAAGVILAILPLVIASRFIQRFIVQGLTFGSVK